jgi:hypothetical protein
VFVAAFSVRNRELNLSTARDYPWLGTLCPVRVYQSSASTCPSSEAGPSQSSNGPGEGQRGFAEFNSLRQYALRDPSGVRSEAERWVAAKRALPARIQAMHASYDALQANDVENVPEQVHKAMTDRPAKRDDLQKRLDGVTSYKASGQKIWDSSAQLRASAETNAIADSDIETILRQDDQLDAVARQAKDTTDSARMLPRDVPSKTTQVTEQRSFRSHGSAVFIIAMAGSRPPKLPE